MRSDLKKKNLGESDCHFFRLYLIGDGKTLMTDARIVRFRSSRVGLKEIPSKILSFDKITDFRKLHDLVFFSALRPLRVRSCYQIQWAAKHVLLSQRKLLSGAMQWILCRFCWFSPTYRCCGMSPAVSTIAESPRNERIGPSTLICAAVRLHRRSDNDSTTRQRWSMSGRNPGFNRILKEIHQNGLSHYALRQPTKFGCVKLCTYLLRAAAKLSKSLANLECLIDF